MRYDHPNSIIRREAQFLLVAGAAAVGARFAAFQKSKLRSISAIVTVAGTATTNTLTVKNGTTSIAVLNVGTATIGSVVRAAVNVDVAAGSVLTVTNGADTLGASHFAYDYEVQPDASYA